MQCENKMAAAPKASGKDRQQDQHATPSAAACCRRKDQKAILPSSPHSRAGRIRFSLNYNRHNRNKVDKIPPGVGEKRAVKASAVGGRRLDLMSVSQLFHNVPKLALFAVLLMSYLGSNCCSAFVLDGSQNSFAQFRKWYTGLNGTLELEFKTEQPNGLVLYTDDGGTYDFFELKLVEGALRLRYNLGGGAQIITVGRDLHDGHWHKVQVSGSLV